ncbi:MAG: Biotin carboxyl carrier protein of acetyl-CoA carboxylase [Chlamydiia bacterium]|nr:Biotin carboxyl carrier protein of acetyl-CoA carboxylase [Chlamydiia bacterium]
MDTKQIKELMIAMERFNMKKLHLKEKNGLEIDLERQGEPERIPMPAQHESKNEAVLNAAATQQAKQTVIHYEAPPAKEVAAGDEHFKPVKSPMVGTFYSSPTPDAPAFVKVGDRVTAKTVVCIVEAMKVMNEVVAGTDGVIKEVLLKDGEPVEFDQPLFKVES